MQDERALNYILEIADALATNHAALMVGAGFSKNAEKIAPTGKSFLSWKELSDCFYKTLYGENSNPGKEYNNSLRLAQEIEIAFGGPKLESLIKEAVPDLEYAPSDLYVTLMEMPWRDVFTTNYDTLLERATEKVTKRRYNVVVCQEDLVSSNDAPRILKLHGSFPSHRPFIITEEDYRTYPVKHAAMVNTVQQALLENVFCMIGFSCEDPNFVQWIGWIHDNLGRTNSPQMYMVSVDHITDAKRQLLFDKNILVIDLDELWHEKSEEDRLRSFLKILSDKVYEKNKKDNWLDFDQSLFDQNLNHAKKVEILKELNESYPGWIFLPWKMKSNVDYVLQRLGYPHKFGDIPFFEKINYMYEYVRFLDNVGRPLIFQTVEMFWTVLDELEKNEFLNGELEHKTQTIYLHLLRAFRELAEWGRYDECRKRIVEAALDYDEKQFLYVCDWRGKLYRFQSDNMAELLDQWKLASGDVYWPLIKGGLYAILGEGAKAESIISENLVIVRRALFKTDQKEYLSSIEESSVSLINFIRMGDFKNKSEESSYKDISWWNENDKYCLHLKAEERKQEDFKVKEKFDLTRSYITHYGADNVRVFHALEYLRFLEQTGHTFRLQNATNTKGLESTIKILAPYYPHWCLMQMFMARDTKMLDSLFGRVQLSSLTQETIDSSVEEYINTIQVVANNLKPDDSAFAKSFFDQAAAVLPEIVARLCYKCSINMLDKMLDTLLEICLSNVRGNFKRLDKTFMGLLHAYTLQEQEERLGKILKFPMDMDRMSHYCDPINYLFKPKEKYTLDVDLYDEVLFQIKRTLDSAECEKKNSAKNRFAILAQIVNLSEKDKEYLYTLLENEQPLVYSVLLYELDSERYSYKLKEIFDATLKKMQQDSNDSGFSVRGETYTGLIDILKDIDIKKIDLRNTFFILGNLVKTNTPWAHDNQREVDQRIRESFKIASGLLLLKNKAKDDLCDDEKEQINQYLSEINASLTNVIVIKVLWSCIGVEAHITYEEFCKSVWLCESDVIAYMSDFYDELFENEFAITRNENLMKCTNCVFEMAIYRATDSESRNIMPALKLCYSLLINNISVESKLEVLIGVLEKLQEATIINEDDSEEEAKYKLKCRIEACLIAEKLYAEGISSEVLEQWKSTSKDKNEYSEIRNIVFPKLDK